MKFSTAVKELLCVHEIFRRLGFLPQHLYVDHYPLEGKVQFALRQRGTTAAPEFTIDIWEDCSDVKETWTAATEWWNSAPQEKVKMVFESSQARKNQVHLVTALAKKGLINQQTEACS